MAGALSAAAGAATGKPQATRAQLSAYITAVETPARSLGREQGRADVAADLARVLVEAGTDDALKLAQRRALRAAAGGQAVKPPESLRNAHTGLVRSARVLAGAAGALATALDGRPSRLEQDEAFGAYDVASERARRLQRQWRSAVITQFRRVRLAVPFWVKQTGAG